ncbi:autoinducer 2 ABC transporter substrate-binding protein [Domibacillus indicus]|uniref:autoinducer 2 ABC transporter substrate-binding protein n=1 Tax=Domibacillus indicus TaxID=1437523 RepID=UPI000ADFC64C|nr:autoinducer 2 ABC transporter substrate-binding protein [Domibacillus indicus]
MKGRLLIVWAAFFFVSGCSNGGTYELLVSNGTFPAREAEESDQSPYTIGIVSKVDNIPYFNSVKEGVMEAAEELKAEVLYEGPTVADAKGQKVIIEKFINQKVDVIAISANDPLQLAPVLKRAKEAGIIVITWDSDTEAEARDLFIDMVNPEVLGRHVMDTLAWNTEEEGTFAIMTGSFSASNHNAWLKWIQAQWKEYYPNMKLVEVVATNDDPHNAFVQAQQLLEKYPDLAGIIGNSSVGPPAAARAAEEAGRAGDIAVVGVSTPDLMRDYLKRGSARVVTLWSPKKLGYLTVAMAKSLIEGKRPADFQYVPGVGTIRVKGNDIVIMGEPIDFTGENVDQYDF